MLRLLTPPLVHGTGAIGLLLFRIVIGGGFVLHGIRKLKHPTTWMQAEGTPPDGPLIQSVTALTEFGSGAAYLLGLFSPLAATGMLLTMIGAIIKVHIPKRSPFVAAPGQPSAESCVVYAAAALLLLLIGPGEYSLDHLWMSITIR
jgi:putative oxidoreductase